MATRLGLIAVRGPDGAGLLELFPELAQDPVEPVVVAGWTWVSLSLWIHGHLFGARAEELLQSRSSLQAWIEDEARWLLAVYRPGRPPARFAQTPDVLLAACRPERLAAPPGRTLAELLAVWEAGLPEEYAEVDPLPDGPLPEAFAALLKRRGRAVSAALAEAGVTHDGEAVAAALTGASVTPEELDWGLGNLPRFLDAAGLGGVFPDWRQDLEDIARRSAAAAAAPVTETDLLAPILAALAEVEAAPILGGPVALDAEDASRLWMVPWSCDNSVEIGFLVRPSGPLPAWPEVPGLSVREGPGGELRVGYAWASTWVRSQVYRQIGFTLVGFPPGTAVEMVAAHVFDPDDEAPLVAGDQRFRGTVRHGRWQLSHAWPAAGADDLKDALRLFREAARDAPFEAKDAAEAAAVTALALRSGLFGEGEDRPRADGRRVTISEDYRPYLALTFFRHRFARGPWDVLAGATGGGAGSAWGDGLISLSRSGDGAAPAPVGEELVHRGRRTGFRRAEIAALAPAPELMAALARLFSTGGGPPSLTAAVAAVDRAMASAGLAPLGDMVCEAFADVVVRGYGKKNGRLYGVLMVGTSGQLVYELYTGFGDGSGLTTSVQPGRHDPEQGILHDHVPDVTLDALLTRHAAGVSRHVSDERRPREHPPLLAALAAEVDALLVRMRT